MPGEGEEGNGQNNQIGAKLTTYIRLQLYKVEIAPIWALWGRVLISELRKNKTNVNALEENR